MPTTLDGYLTDDNPSLLTKVDRWFAHLRANKPEKLCHLKVSWKDYDSGSTGKIDDIRIKAPYNPTAARNVIDAVRSAIHEHAGQEPDGTLLCRGIHDGEASDPAFTHQRRIKHDPAGDADRVTARIVEDLRKDNAELRQHNRELVGDLRDQLAVQGATIQKQSEEIRHLAVQRSVGTTAADAGGTWSSLIGLGILVLGWPAIRKAFDIPENATTEQAIGLIQAGISKRLASDGPGKTTPPPEGSWRDGAAGLLTDGEPADGEGDESPQEPQDLVALALAELEQDPGALKVMLKRLQSALMDKPDLAVDVAKANPAIVQAMQSS